MKMLIPVLIFVLGSTGVAAQRQIDPVNGKGLFQGPQGGPQAAAQKTLPDLTDIIEPTPMATVGGGDSGHIGALPDGAYKITAVNAVEVPGNNGNYHTDTVQRPLYSFAVLRELWL